MTDLQLKEQLAQAYARIEALEQQVQDLEEEIETLVLEEI